MKTLNIKTALKTVLASSILAATFSAHAAMDMGAIQSQQESAMQMQENMSQMASNMERAQAMQETMQNMAEQTQTMQAIQEKMQTKTQTMTQLQERTRAELNNGDEQTTEQSETPAEPVAETDSAADETPAENTQTEETVVADSAQ